MEPLLAIRDLTVRYDTKQGPVHAVDGAWFDVPRGELVGLVGESGCGKTTVARAVMGVVPRNAAILGGPVLFEGRDLITLPERERRALRWREIAFIPQTAMSALDPVYRVGRQIEEVLRERGGRSRSQARARAEELFGLVGIEARRLEDYPHQFSRPCYLVAEPLKEAADWVEQYRIFWEQSLDRLDAYLKVLQAQTIKGSDKSKVSRKKDGRRTRKQK
ncbi:ATP-binding cassette domain-containing protein [Leptolyngbya sp. 15MV]|nr:ATP-binding cassette domain-containing protein [Leptolyngbya sp. 15MV]